MLFHFLSLLSKQNGNTSVKHEEGGNEDKTIEGERIQAVLQLILPDPIFKTVPMPSVTAGTKLGAIDNPKDGVVFRNLSLV